MGVQAALAAARQGLQERDFLVAAHERAGGRLAQQAQDLRAELGRTACELDTVFHKVPCRRRHGHGRFAGRTVAARASLSALCALHSSHGSGVGSLRADHAGQGVWRSPVLCFSGPGD